MSYTEEQRQVALKLYDETHSVSKVIHRLGYPSKMGMYTWIGIRNRPLWQKGVRKRLINTPKHPLHPPLSLKMDILFCKNESLTPRFKLSIYGLTCDLATI